MLRLGSGNTELRFTLSLRKISVKSATLIQLFPAVDYMYIYLATCSAMQVPREKSNKHRHKFFVWFSRLFREKVSIFNFLHRYFIYKLNFCQLNHNSILTQT